MVGNPALATGLDEARQWLPERAQDRMTNRSEEMEKMDDEDGAVADE